MSNKMTSRKFIGIVLCSLIAGLNFGIGTVVCPLWWNEDNLAFKFVGIAIAIILIWVPVSSLNSFLKD